MSIRSRDRINSQFEQFLFICAFISICLHHGFVVIWLQDPEQQREGGKRRGGIDSHTHARSPTEPSGLSGAFDPPIIPLSSRRGHIMDETLRVLNIPYSVTMKIFALKFMGNYCEHAAYERENPLRMAINAQWHTEKTSIGPVQSYHIRDPTSHSGI
ncbi:hypothetical protein M422DRAFT_56326 [Sphaerobolus stellatus SS14]|uniref:Uncharacterized protein n=1 Tax=Sphaerobolus stellatus (strain SS14) TaxID=990650 RepID=A0A0C9UGT1_SPHS4|nr:hypothetical protein M422DRAFT_56326 [Sphaerobolus stellatus SS14]